MLRIDERRRSARLLRVGDDMQRKRRLAGRLVSIAFDDASARKPPDTQRQIERQTASRDDLDGLVSRISKPQDRHLAKLLFNGLHDLFQC